MSKTNAQTQLQNLLALMSILEVDVAAGEALMEEYITLGEALGAEGYTLLDVADWQGRQVSLKALADVYPDGDYLIYVGGAAYHMFDGKVQGWEPKDRKRVRQITRVTHEDTVAADPIRETLDALSDVVGRPVGVGMEPKQPKQRKQHYDRTSPRGACAMVHELADVMVGATRKEVIDEAIEQGIHPTTAAVQYQKWFKANKRG